MKTFISGSILLTIALSCNQSVYDQIYQAIIQKTIRTQIQCKDTEKCNAISRIIMEDRNNTIELLRKLCNGQKSTWEGQK